MLSPETDSPSARGRGLPSLAFVRHLFWPLFVTALPLAITRKIWWQVWHSGIPRAWDGAGHYGIAEIYARTIFPDTLGWVPSYFGGMPFPNFYPPLFYWCAALLERPGLFGFLTAFKLILSLSVALLPAAVWFLGYAVSDKDRVVATAAALASIPLLVDTRSWVGLPPGLDYYSTFQIGLYTQPLAFLLLAAWFAVYVRTRTMRHWRWTLSCLLLASAALANFFVAVIAALFAAVTLLFDAVKYLRAARRRTDASAASEARTVLLAHLLCPAVSLGLTLFWVVPMLATYKYFVTRPYYFSPLQMISPIMWGLYALAAAGGVCWLRRPTTVMWPYLLSCLTIIVGFLFAGTVAPHWFPLQPPRFLGTLNVLLTVPAGFAGAAFYRSLADTLRPAKPSGQTSATHDSAPAASFVSLTGAALVLIIVVDAFIFIEPPPTDVAFYPVEGQAAVSGVLGFGQTHRDGRYLVEADLPNGAVKFDARAINAYLGAQGNQTLSAVFHEASPNALFLLPTADAFSGFPDTFGISSVLADDLDFAEQPLSQHIRRAQSLGVRYLVVYSQEVKGRLELEPGVGARHDFDGWSVFELKAEPAPPARVLPFRPALVVSSLTLKERRRGEYNFIRLAEEQFADGWFGVLLARSPEMKIDRLRDLGQFGALILDSYECDDEERAYRLLRDYASRRVLVLLSSEANLFKRIRANRAEFPLAEFVERQASAAADGVLDATEPTFRYKSTAIRKEWALIRRALERGKVATETGEASVPAEVGLNEIRLSGVATSSADTLPVLVNSTYHPNWRRDDRGEIYAVTPFNMLLFTRQPTRLFYGRRALDDVGLWLSASAFASLILLTCWHYRRQLFRSVSRRDAHASTIGLE